MDILSSLFGFLLALCLTLKVHGEDAVLCGGQVDASVAGYITSPGYPLEYPPHQSCQWVITAPEPSQRIALNFNPHFELEKLDCRYDFIEIHDGSSEAAELLGKHCSNIAPPPIISSGSTVYIKFVSDYAHQGAGFSLRYEIYKTGAEYCFRNFTSPSGVIESPGFPDKYPHNLECSFIIISPPRMEVTLTFLTFDLENDPLLLGEGDCKYDWLDVWDGLPQVGPLIGRYCGTKIPPEIQSSTGLLSLTFHTDMAVAKDGFSARYNMTYREVSDTAFHCSNPFGMESGRISDDQITASSSYYDGRWSPRQARLNNMDNAWTPNEDSNKEYIQVDLHFLKVLTGIATQGAISKDTQKSYYVLTFKLEVSTNGEDWMTYRHGKNHKIFHANTDPSEVVLNRVPQPVLARFVRIRPQTYNNGIALRFELYGCQITDAPCSELQGMLSGQLPDSQISASSSRELHWSPSAARLVASRSGWFPQPTQPLAGEEWLQVDLGKVKTVRGLITQGARSTEAGGTSAENRAFVRKYKLAHSLDGKDWNWIMDSKTSTPKVFEGNTHFDAPELRRFEEIPAQFLRVYPERWSPAGIGMRMEVLGCNLPETSTVPESTTPTTAPPPQPGTSDLLSRAPSTPPSSQEGVCDFERGLCGWTHDPASGLVWTLHISNGSPTPSLDIAQGSNSLGNYLYMEASPEMEGQRARLLSPELGADVGPLCLLFSYQLVGPGSLRVFLRNPHLEETLLWSQRGDQGPVWKEGRTILPRSPKEFQVVIEGLFEHSGKGHIWIDSVHMNASTPLEECTQPFSSFPPVIKEKRPVEIGDSRLLNAADPVNEGFPFVEWTTAPPSELPVTRVSEKDNSWLYTLDPILLTIIVMSSLGVLLGAVCAGLLLYCTCSYSGLSSRSSTTLENYNFELYDGIKHKVKLNQQRCCSEA
ncbi:neuropilin-2-like isoform X1 [Alosa sapidissima]|uniref:neuropilin-2-like isoform X1 n=1 Tax=Alosa sapidissima TaxID=34773 RepID=UPI001C0821B4|nr:neuropilin-2-like isoform X1 [Alosa sapidissima]XP_041935692.1 neuropilin-2-like isoform X1 [Alosa sapidissima]XP_041935693.1 neuropilin-2-like isoform X1 [Alosa sapidissima]